MSAYNVMILGDAVKNILYFVGVFLFVSAIETLYARFIAEFDYTNVYYVTWL